VLAAAERLGHPLVVVGPDPDIALSLSGGYDEYFQADYRNLGQLEALCVDVLRERRVWTVTSLEQDGQLPAARARELLGLPGLSSRMVATCVNRGGAPSGATGRRFTVETLSSAGVRTHVAVVARWESDDGLRVGYMMPAGLEPAMQGRIESAVSDALDALDIETAVTSTDVVVSGSGVVVTRTRTGPGGDHLAELTHLVTGVDWRATALSAATGGRLLRDESRHAAAGAVVGPALAAGGQGSVLVRADDVVVCRATIATLLKASAPAQDVDGA